ncbi:MAG: Rrf2 family transcriptional regulator [Phycisphaerae bacterium]|nr:Rrf2 family transcriptional regulator [Phycisphaerae bacterium]
MGYIIIPIELVYMVDMRFSKKCQYALRAVFELACRQDGQPAKIQDIGRAQGISPRFLEVILNELRHAGIVESRRGNEGGYLLAGPAESITVGEVIRCVQGPIAVAGQQRDGDGGIFGDEAFEGLWYEIDKAVSDVCDGRTFAEMVESARQKRRQMAPNYVI